MDRFSFENINENSFLVFMLDQEDLTDSFSLGMLKCNQISGFLPFSCSQHNSNIFFKYQITARISLTQFLKRVLLKEQVIDLLISLVEALKSSKGYMLPNEGIIVDFDYVFVELSGNSLQFAYLPLIRSRTTSLDIRHIVKQIMNECQFNESEEISYVAKIINFINCGTEFRLSEFKQFLTDLLDKKIPVEPNMEASELNTQNHLSSMTPVSQCPNVQEMGLPIFPSKKEKLPMKANQLQHKSSFLAKIFPRKVVAETNPFQTILDKRKLESDLTPDQLTNAALVNVQSKQVTPKIIEPIPNISEKTTVLSLTTKLGTPQQANTAKYLLHKKSSEKIPLTKDAFRIGKEGLFVDYVIGNNRAISRCHAEVLQRENCTYLKDCNSRNGSFINNLRATCNTETLIRHNDRIRLANEEFVFKEYDDFSGVRNEFS